MKLENIIIKKAIQNILNGFSFLVRFEVWFV